MIKFKVINPLSICQCLQVQNELEREKKKVEEAELQIAKFQEHLSEAKKDKQSWEYERKGFLTEMELLQKAESKYAQMVRIQSHFERLFNKIA